jgi:hypothetical protein
LAGRRRFSNKFLKIQIPDRGADGRLERLESSLRQAKQVPSATAAQQVIHSIYLQPAEYSRILPK